MKYSAWTIAVFSAVLAFTLSTFLYFSFNNIYSVSILSRENFETQFFSGIYKFRLLSSWLVLAVYDFLQSFTADYGDLQERLPKTADARMLIALYAVNTLFLILSALLLTFITSAKEFCATGGEKIAAVVVAIFVMVFTQYVLVPYDVSAYFFFLFFLWILLTYLRTKKTILFIAMLGMMIISTLNRETAALSLSVAATLFYREEGFGRQFFIRLIWLTLAFLAVYSGLRLSFGGFTTNDGNLLAQNFTEPKNGLGLLFWLLLFAFTLLFARDRKAQGNILLFHLFALPYLAFCLYSGILYEVRLYVPLFLGGLFLSRVHLFKEKI